MAGEKKSDKEGGKKTENGEKKSGKGGNGKTQKPCSKGGVFMGGTIGITPKPNRNNYYNVVTSRDGTPSQSLPCRAPGPPAGTTPIIICPPNNYSPPNCPRQPIRRCC